MKKKPHNRWRMILLMSFELLIISIFTVSAYAISVMKKIEYEQLSSNVFLGSYDYERAKLEQEEQAGAVQNGQAVPQTAAGSLSVNQDQKVQVETENMSITNGGEESIDQALREYRTIAVLGVDARDQDKISKGVNSDVILLVSIHEPTKQVKMASVYRDTLMRLVSGGTAHPDREYDKANSQICYTGISDMISMLNQNLDLNIQEYVIVNWSAAAEVVNTIGGIDVTIEDPKIIEYLNGYLTEVNESTGIHAPQLSGTGTFTLSGTQAVAFCRIRYAGLGDQGRTANQRMVVEKCLEQAKNLLFTNPSRILKAVSQIADGIVTNLTMEQMTELAWGLGQYEIVETCGYPNVYITDEYVGSVYEQTHGVKDPLVPVSVEENVKMLHQFLYGSLADAYQTPDFIKTISMEIEKMTLD